MKSANTTDGEGPSMVAAGVPFYSMSPTRIHWLGGQPMREWEQLRGWWERFNPGEAIYALPEKVIGEFGKLGRLTDERCDQENQFRRLCELNHTIGFLPDGLPIHCPSLLPVAKPIWAQYFEMMGWSGKRSFDAMGLVEKLDSTFARLRGITGWLVTDPKFREDVAELRRTWSETESGVPRFPLDRPFTLPPHSDGLEEREGISAFDVRLGDLLDRWGLLQLASWDLPIPQAPLLPNPVPAHFPASPKNGIHIVVPLHYDIRQTDELHRQIETMQREATERLGIEQSFAGVGNLESYAQMFDIWLMEKAMMSRFPPKSQPKEAQDRDSEPHGQALPEIRRAHLHVPQGHIELLARPTMQSTDAQPAGLITLQFEGRENPMV